MNDWNIQSRAHTCEGCHKPFVDKQWYHTLLFENGTDLCRLDYCTECWKIQFADDNEGHRRGFISQWQGVYQAPEPVAEAIQKETAETLLKKLIELNDPNYVPAGFILAVMLERKRVLKVKEQVSRSDGKRAFIYEQHKTGEVYTITDPNLHLDQLEEVQRDVAQLLESGLTAPKQGDTNPSAETTALPPSSIVNVAETG